MTLGNERLVSGNDVGAVRRITFNLDSSPGSNIALQNRLNQIPRAICDSTFPMKILRAMIHVIFAARSYVQRSAV